MCGRSVTAFLVPPRSQHPGQGPCSPHPKAGPRLRCGVMKCTSQRSPQMVVNSQNAWVTAVPVRLYSVLDFVLGLIVNKLLNIYVASVILFSISISMLRCCGIFLPVTCSWAPAFLIVSSKWVKCVIHTLELTWLRWGNFLHGKYIVWDICTQFFGDIFGT
jgi:hypothetical protein